MPNFTLKLGALDLSPYVRVNPQDAQVEPYPEFLEPSFSDAPFADGDPLTAVSVKNREQSWPLYLHGAANTKDQLHALIQQITLEISKVASSPLLVEWKDAGASNSTFYDVVYARFDPNFNFRAGEKGWLAGVLHVWSTGYGHTGTTRIAATGAGSGVAFVVPVPSIGGDVPPLMDMRFAEGSYTNLQGRILGFAALPHPSYSVRIPVASFLNIVGASVVGASGGDGSQAIGAVHQATPMLPFAFSVAISPASIYAGQSHRVLMPARAQISALNTGGGRPQTYPAYLRADVGGVPIGPTSMPTAADWALLDLGLMRVPSVVPATLMVNVRGVMNKTGALVAYPDTPVSFGAPSAAVASGYSNEFGPLILLPDAQSEIVLDTPRTLLGYDTVKGVASANPIYTRTDELGNAWATSALNAGPGHFSDGVFLQTPDNTMQIMPGFLSTGATGINRARLEHAPANDLLVEGAVNINTGGASVQVQGLIKELTGIPNVIFEGIFRTLSSASGSIELYVLDSNAGGVGTVLLASAAVSASLMSDGSPFDRLKLKLLSQGPQLTLTAEGFNSKTLGVPPASVGASHAYANVAGKGGIALWAFPNASVTAQNISGFRVTGLPSQAQAASDMYEIDQYTQQVSRTSGANIDSIPIRARGKVRPTPSTPAFAVLSGLIDKGTTSDLLSVDIRVRERFFYAR